MVAFVSVEGAMRKDYLNRAADHRWRLVTYAGWDQLNTRFEDIDPYYVDEATGTAHLWIEIDVNDFAPSAPPKGDASPSIPLRLDRRRAGRRRCFK